MSFATAPKHEIAWAAGLFEGEGSVGCWGARKSLRAVMYTTDRDVLEKFVSVVGIGRISDRPRKPRPSNLAKKDQWCWTASGFRNVQAICAAFWLWLGERRRGQATKALMDGRTILNGGRYRRLKRVCPAGHTYTPETTYINPTSKVRRCLICSKAYMRAYNQARKNKCLLPI
jgi:hypothetical protein